MQVVAGMTAAEVLYMNKSTWGHFCKNSKKKEYIPRELNTVFETYAPFLGCSKEKLKTSYVESKVQIKNF